MSSTEYPQVVVSEPSEMRAVPDESSIGSDPARAGAIAAAAAQLEGHDYEYAQAVANAAAAAAAEDAMSAGHHSTHSTHEVVRSDGGHVRPSTIVQVEPTPVGVRQNSISAEVEVKA
jgi:hypothetical protein